MTISKIIPALLVCVTLAGCFDGDGTAGAAARLGRALDPVADAPSPDRSYEVAVDVKGSGEVVVSSKGFACASSCSFLVAEGDVLGLTAQPRGGARFKSWSGACSGPGRCNLRVSGNLRIDATFEESATSEPPPPSSEPPPPATAPPSDPAAPPPLAASEDLAFLDVTRDTIGGSCAPQNHFDFDFMDANADGLYDLFVLSHLGVEHCLFVQKRDGSGTFAYVSGAEANYRQEKIPPRGSSRATFIDLDGDGFEEITTTEADIMAAVFPNATSQVGGSVRYGTKREWCSAKDQCTVGDLDGDGRMERIRGDRSAETLVSGERVVAAASPQASIDWHVVDLDGDSWPDLVDVAAGGYWRNSGGSLSWQAVSGFAPCTFGRHQDFADFDNDGDLDVACSSGTAKLKNTGGSRHLLRNDGGGRFTDVTAGSGFEQLAWLPYYSNYSNSYAADLDNDGWIDYVTSGSSYRLGVQILRNVGGMKFQLQSLEFASQFAGGGGKPRVDVADYDHDGWLDLLTGQDEAPSVRLYRNVTGGQGNWLGLRLRGAGDNTGGLNATVRVYRAGSEELLGSFQVLNHSDGQMHDLHVGLGAATQVDVEIAWPHDGGVERLRAVDANQTLSVTYRSGGSQVAQGWMPGNGV